MNTSAPIIQQQELTTRCNNNCQFCYNPERCLKAFLPRSEETKRNIKIAEISVAKGVMAVCPTGGEPLLVGDHLFDILDIYKNADCYASINTNARLATKEVARKLFSSKLNSALTSIHGIGDLHNKMVGDDNAFNETWNGILNLKDQGIAVMPNFVATAQNIHGLVNVGKALLNSGFKSMTVTPFLPSWGSPQHEEFLLTQKQYEKYFQAIRSIRENGMKIDSTLPIPPCALISIFPKNWHQYLDVHSPRVCMAGKSFGVISPDGNFRACIQAPYLPDFGGNMLDSYSESWRRANHWAQMKLIPRECRDCNALNICGGGCRTSCLWENSGSASGKTMYMGKALTIDEALPFQRRIESPMPKISSDQTYAWEKSLRMRTDNSATIIFNPACQSFTLLATKETLNPDRKIKFADKKTAGVLLSIGAIKLAETIDEKTQHSSATILPARVLLPRLASNCNNNEKIYCLRSDTGERYFF